MRDVVLVEKIVELMSLSRAPRGEHTQSCKLAIATQSPSSHDQRVHDWFANPWHLGKRVPEFISGHRRDLGFVRCSARRRDRRPPFQRRLVAEKVALVRNRELLLHVIPPLEDLYFATQNNGKADVPLPGFIHDFAPACDTPLSKWFKQRQLMIV